MAQWKAAGVVEQLPPEDALASFLSEAYQASLLREEGRSVVCRLILINLAELGDNAGPPNGLHVLRFEEERPIHEQEIRRLSPTATFYRSLIGVRWDSGHGFLIRGIINSGSRWISQTAGGRLRGYRCLAGWQRAVRRESKWESHLLGHLIDLKARGRERL